MNTNEETSLDEQAAEMLTGFGDKTVYVILCLRRKRSGSDQLLCVSISFYEFPFHSKKDKLTNEV